MQCKLIKTRPRVQTFSSIFHQLCWLSKPFMPIFYYLHLKIADATIICSSKLLPLCKQDSSSTLKFATAAIAVLKSWTDSCWQLPPPVDLEKQCQNKCLMHQRLSCSLAWTGHQYLATRMLQLIACDGEEFVYQIEEISLSPWRLETSPNFIKEADESSSSSKPANKRLQCFQAVSGNRVTKTSSPCAKCLCCKFPHQLRKRLLTKQSITAPSNVRAANMSFESQQLSSFGWAIRCIQAILVFICWK